MLDHLIIPKLIFFLILITYLGLSHQWAVTKSGTGMWELERGNWDGTRELGRGDVGLGDAGRGTRRRGTRGRGMRGLGDAWRLGDVINKPDFLICKV